MTVRGAPEQFKYQSRHDLVRLSRIKAARAKDEEGKPVNPCEKTLGTFLLLPLIPSLGANHWVITSFTKIGEAAVTLTSGSGSFVEACMRLGRHCLAIEIDGLFPPVATLVEKQFEATCRRMIEVEAYIRFAFLFRVYFPSRKQMDTKDVEYQALCEENEINWAYHYTSLVKVLVVFSPCFF